MLKVAGQRPAATSLNPRPQPTACHSQRSGRDRARAKHAKGVR